eukprot:130143_1
MTSFLSRVIQDAMDAIILPLGSTDHQQTATWNTIYVIVCGLYLLSCGAMVAELGLGIHAKYGRFAPLNSFCAIPAHIAWCLQELPSFAFASYFLIQSFQETFEMVPIANRLLLLLFIVHYANRTFIYPFNIRGGKATPFMEFVLAVLVTSSNGIVQGLCLTRYKRYMIHEIYDFHFIFGVTIFITGFIMNLHSDSILRNLRTPNETGYKIPYGGLYNFVTAGNYFGEVIEWLGFAIAGSNAGGCAFAIMTFCNLFPRAVQTHTWYQKKFDNYPKDRKILIPFLL